MVGAHHRNGIAERQIRTIIQMARSSLLHAKLKWSQKLPANFWTFAIQHAVDSWNSTPRKSGHSPEELFSRTKQEYAYSHRHTFGCPAYVLNSKLQQGQKIPHWEQRSQQGIFLGYSKDHA